MSGNENKSDTAYWDYISTLSPKESKETIKELCQNNFYFLRPYMDELFWVDSNVVFLNLVCGVPQMVVARIMGSSQLGVSKRVRTSWKKIRNILLRPEKDVVRVRKDFQMILGKSLVETAVVYYQLKTFSVTAKFLGGVKEGAVRVRVHQVLEQLEEVSSCQTEKNLLDLLVEKIQPMRLDEFRHKLSTDGFNSILDMASRYLEYFRLILPVGYYSDFIYKKFDGLRGGES